MSSSPKSKWSTLALICLLGTIYVCVHIAYVADYLDDKVTDSIKLGLIFFLCVIGFLAGRTFFEFTRTTPVFLAAMIFVLLLHITELTEEFAQFQSIPLFGKTTLTKHAFETTLMIGTLCLFLMGMYLSVASINRTREAMDAHIQQLQESEQRNRRILDTIQDSLAITDADGKFLHVNAAFCHQYGYSLDELIHMHATELIHPDYHHIFQQFKEQIQKSGYFTGETVDLRKDGSSFYTEVQGAPIVLANQVSLLAVIRDVTQRKKAEVELMDYQEKLRAMASDLTLTEERLKRSTAELLHDDIGQLLAFLKMKVQIVHESFAGDTGLDRELIQVSDMLTEILHKVRFLTFELGSPILSELGLEKAIAAWLEDVFQEAHGIPTTFLDDGQPKSLSEDLRFILFRCVKELLNNSIKHARPRSIQVSISREGDKAVIVVTDDGQGFSPQEIASRSPTLGFGLFSIRERLASMGGELLLESSPGQGCKATLRAPCG